MCVCVCVYVCVCVCVYPNTHDIYIIYKYIQYITLVDIRIRIYMQRMYHLKKLVTVLIF